MDSQVSSKNAFRLEGMVHRISPLQFGQKQSTGKEWCKVDILLSMFSENNYRTYYYPIVLWGAVAKKAIEEKRLSSGDYISVVGQIGCHEYNSNYYPNLTGYDINVITKGSGEVPAITKQEVDDDVPF